MRSSFSQCVLALLVSMFAFGSGALAQQKSQLDVVLERGYVIVGTTSESPPFGFIDESGELAGFDIDLGRLLAKAIFDDEKKVEFLKQGFPARWANIESGKIDVGIQDTTVHGTRALRVAFTRPYVESGQTLLVRADSTIASYADLNSGEYTVALLTTPAQEAWRQQYFPNAKPLVFDSISAEFTALASGRADAAVIARTTALWYAKQHSEFRVIPGLMSPPLNNAFFVRRDDFTWWKVVDTIVGEMVGGGLFGEYSAIYEKWFGVKPHHEKYWATASQ